jgi:hypothetical protein
LHTALHAPLPDIETSWLPGLSPECCQEKLQTLARLEVVFQQFCRQALTPKALRDQISTHHLEWIRLDGHYVALPEEQMAREAALCVREDAMALTEVAARAKTVVHRAHFYLDQLEPAWQPLFLGAQAGELLGPLRMAETCMLFWVLDKVMPSIDDLEVRQRAEQRVLQQAIDHEIHTRVHWQSGLPGEGHGRRAVRTL